MVYHRFSLLVPSIAFVKFHLFYYLLLFDDIYKRVSQHDLTSYVNNEIFGHLCLEYGKD